MNNKFAIFSDLHLGTHNNSLFWLDVAKTWTEWFVVELKKHNITDILFLGDYYEYRDDVSVLTLNVGAEILDMLSDFNLIMIPGNHDCFYKMRGDVNSLNIANKRDKVRVYSERKVLEICSKKVLLLPWGAEISDLNEKFDYIFGHLEINTFKMNGSKLCEKGMSPTDLLKLSNNIYSGHFHQRDSRFYNDSHITYVGNCFETNFGEVGSAKGFHILDFQTNQLEFIENETAPKHKKILISDIPTTSADVLKKNIVRVVVNQKIESREVEKVLNNLKVHCPADCTVEYMLPAANEAIPIKLTEATVSYETSISEFVNQLSMSEDEKKPIISKCIEFLKKCKV